MSELALKLIEENLRTKNTRLELGYCDLNDENTAAGTPFDLALRQCTHLQTLIFNNTWSELNEIDEIVVRTSYNSGSKNGFDTPPPALSALTGLRNLICAGDYDNRWGITNMVFVSDLLNLNQLELSNNKITEIKGLDNLTQLNTLSIRNNQITEIKGLENLTQLNTLSIRNNQITEIKGLENLTQLNSLGISDNQITEIKGLENLTQLNSLKVRGNRIREIKGLSKLTQLHSLDISFNQITELKGLDNLTQLRLLDISYNQITELKGLDNLTQLNSLNINNNQITELSPLIFLLKRDIYPLRIVIRESWETHIGEISVKGNPLNAPPIEIVKQGNTAILDWLAANKKRLDEIKIILIASPKAGKTSLLKRLKDDSFKEGEVQTDGVNIEHILFKETTTFKNYIKLHGITGDFWDFGGQEIMNATHQFFLTNRSVYILVLDARNDANVPAQIRQWVKRIKATADNSSIIVTANQADVNTGFGFENEYELTEEFRQIKYFIKTSCSTGEGIEQLKEKLEELVPAAEMFNTEVDEHWIPLLEQLRTETGKGNYLNEKRFDEICEKHKLYKTHEKKNAISFLHDLGIVLHFEDIHLAEYFVLDPYWITYGVYQIITSKYAAGQKGMVSMDKLSYVINEEEDKNEIYKPADFKKITYSTNERRFLVDILNRFKLSFYLPENRYFIIPDLLETTEPIDITQPIREDANTIRFVYAYDYLPKSVMPNFMVETHKLIKQMWRTGCVLEYNECKALVSSYENMLSIYVCGAHKKKREFMAIIRCVVDKINPEPGGQIKTLIPLDGTNDFAEYEVLLKREQRGKRIFIHDEDKPTEKEYEISSLLEGIPGQDEVSSISIKIDKILEKVEVGFEMVKNDLLIVT